MDAFGVWAEGGRSPGLVWAAGGGGEPCTVQGIEPIGQDLWGDKGSRQVSRACRAPVHGEASTGL